MANAKGKSMYGTLLAKTLAWGALAVSITASPVLAQEIVGGNFTLSESARFGETVVVAGQYEFSIEPIGNLQSVGSIQEGVSHLVLVVLRSEKFGTVASMFAMASGSKNASETDELILEPSKNGTLARTLSLERGGLVGGLPLGEPQAEEPDGGSASRPRAKCCRNAPCWKQIGAAWRNCRRTLFLGSARQFACSDSE